MAPGPVFVGVILLLFGPFALAARSQEAENLSPAAVRETMRRAAEFFVEELSLRGGYVYYWAPDGSNRLGEGAATDTEIWVQPPATPAVGEAFLEGYRVTGEEFYLDAARAAGEVLVFGQLESGGWRNSIDFDPEGPRTDRYRGGRGNPKGKNFSTLDDGITQGALAFLFRLDGALEFSDEEIHEAAESGLASLLDAQFPNGGFPQGWRAPVGDDHPVKDASFPDYDWKTEGRIKNYWDCPTLNDGVAGHVLEALLAAEEIRGKTPETAEAIRGLGDFLARAQLPDPQPAWAQQYSPEMIPIWARKFEPPAIAARESEDACLALLGIASHAGETRYLEPVVPAVKYLERSFLLDGRLPRYLELESNRPLYMQRRGDVYSLTHDDSDLPSHYGWKNAPRLEEIKDGWRAVFAGKTWPPPPSPPRAAEVSALVDALDEQGRWISEFGGELLVGQPKFREGESYLSSEVFTRNFRMLARWLEGGK